jgi:hypothetical protein
MLEKGEDNKNQKKGGITSSFRARRAPIANADPFRPQPGGEHPSLDAVARGVLSHPLLVEEIIRHLAYTEPSILDQMEQQIAVARQRARSVLNAVREGSFGREYVAEGLEGDASRLNISAGNAAVAYFQRTGKIPPCFSETDG